MKQELLYTSAPKGLKPGSRGFCTVVSSEGMSAPLATLLESLSGYRPLFAPNDPREPQNPVVFSHLLVQSTGKPLHVLSRISSYGLDYSQRANKIAHHVVIDPRDFPSAGPVWLLQQPGFLRDHWDGNLQITPANQPIPQGSQSPRRCVAWEKATGDAGWGGVLAESFFTSQDSLAFLIYEPGTDLLPLLDEALSLLPPEQRWRVTMSTFFSKLPAAATCHWRCIPAGTPEAHESRRHVRALRIDLTQPLPQATGGALVSVARTGQQTSQRAAAAAQIPHSTQTDAPGSSRRPLQSVPAPPAMSRIAPPQRKQAKSSLFRRWWVRGLLLVLLTSGVTTGWYLYSKKHQPDARQAAAETTTEEIPVKAKPSVPEAQPEEKQTEPSNADQQATSAGQPAASSPTSPLDGPEGSGQGSNPSPPPAGGKPESELPSSQSDSEPSQPTGDKKAEKESEPARTHYLYVDVSSPKPSGLETADDNENERVIATIPIPLEHARIEVWVPMDQWAPEISSDYINAFRASSTNNHLSVVSRPNSAGSEEVAIKAELSQDTANLKTDNSLVYLTYQSSIPLTTYRRFVIHVIDSHDDNSGDDWWIFHYPKQDIAETEQKSASDNKDKDSGNTYLVWKAEPSPSPNKLQTYDLRIQRLAVRLGNKTLVVQREEKGVHTDSSIISTAEFVNQLTDKDKKTERITFAAELKLSELLTQSWKNQYGDDDNPPLKKDTQGTSIQLPSFALSKTSTSATQPKETEYCRLTDCQSNPQITTENVTSLLKDTLSGPDISDNQRKNLSEDKEIPDDAHNNISKAITGHLLNEQFDPLPDNIETALSNIKGRLTGISNVLELINTTEHIDRHRELVEKLNKRKDNYNTYVKVLDAARALQNDLSSLKIEELVITQKAHNGAEEQYVPIIYYSREEPDE